MSEISEYDYYTWF